MQFTNAEGLTKKIVWTSSPEVRPLQGRGLPLRAMTPEEREYLQHLLDNIYQQFLTDVARNRKMPVEKLKPLAEGRIYSGEEAKQVGLVDDFGNLPDAIQRAGKLAGIKGKVEAVYPQKDRFSCFVIWWTRRPKSPYPTCWPSPTPNRPSCRRGSSKGCTTKTRKTQRRKN